MANTITLSDAGEELAFPERIGEGGRYVLGRKLGQGGFGTVFEASDAR